MKLKLETQSGVRLLKVSESISSTDIGVLRAGVAKLFAEGKNPLVLDLTQAKLEALARVRLSDVLATASGETQVLFVASADAELATAPTVQACLELIATPSANLLALEARLKARVALAKAQKIEVDQKLDQTAALATELKKLKREVGELRRMECALESQVSTKLASRKKPPMGTDPSRDALLDAHDVLRKIFAPMGFVKEKAG